VSIFGRAAQRQFLHKFRYAERVEIHGLAQRDDDNGFGVVNIVGTQECADEGVA